MRPTTVLARDPLLVEKKTTYLIGDRTPVEVKK